MIRSITQRPFLAGAVVASAAVLFICTATAGTEPYAAGDRDGSAQVASMHGAEKDIVATASDAAAFSTLVTAVSEAGLVETLQGEGPFTVFAPTDTAFGKLAEGTVEDLLKPENRDTLTRILTYHVVPGKVTSADIAGQSLDAETVAGVPLAIDATGDTVMVGGATVTTADVMASNGVIHVIDTVLMPN
ncbi:fasciclin domain-containing protein [Roseospira goensis]|uniref:Putative surface protein with fasciclin (FAS1) repeats n=1 Tax=Roseospira goensis TaxID=391922 RepID=A0A7W6S2W7_9PROT|nr:fasciclin domain-containing protein [Roseospira goensis]MBB4287903.1 putative surface protein with fasciclin (FAS1) repeats [Roseospira goensis]